MTDVDLNRHIAPQGQDVPQGTQGLDPNADQAWLDKVHVVSGTSRMGTALATEMQVPLGAIVNIVLCRVGDQLSVVLMAGDMPCDAAQVSRAFNQDNGHVVRLSDAEIAQETGTTIENLFTIPLAHQWPAVMDASLQRFDQLFTRAGSPRCLIETSYGDLKALTGAIVSYALAPTDWRLKT